MNLRENITERQRWAHAVLDDVRDGLAHSHRDVREALRVLGDLL